MLSDPDPAKARRVMDATTWTPLRPSPPAPHIPLPPPPPPPPDKRFETCARLHGPLALADTAIEGRAARLCLATHDAAAPATPAARALAVVDPEPRRSISRAGRPRDRLVQHLFDGRRQTVCSRPRDTCRRGDRQRQALGRQTGDVQRFTDIDVPETGNDPLVEESDLQRGLPARTGAGQRGAVEVRGQRLWTQRAQRGMRRQRVRRQEIHHSEPARIVEDHLRARCQVKDDVVVTIAAGHRISGGGRLLDPERAGHAEMHHQRLAGRQLRQQVLRAALEAHHRPPCDTRREALRKRGAEIRATELEAVDAGSGHDRRELAPDGLDFWQFGHTGDSLATSTMLDLANLRSRRLDGGG